MKVEVGDWVKLRGMKRIYEVEKVERSDGTYARPWERIKLVGNKAMQPASHVEAVAANEAIEALARVTLDGLTPIEVYGEVLTAGPKGWRTVTVSRAEIISIEQMGGRIVLKFRDQ